MDEIIFKTKFEQTAEFITDLNRMMENINTVAAL